MIYGAHRGLRGVHCARLSFHCSLVSIASGWDIEWPVEELALGRMVNVVEGADCDIEFSLPLVGHLHVGFGRRERCFLLSSSLSQMLNGHAGLIS